jgi:hypothetical protein
VGVMKREATARMFGRTLRDCLAGEHTRKMQATLKSLKPYQAPKPRERFALLDYLFIERRPHEPR